MVGMGLRKKMVGKMVVGGIWFPLFLLQTEQRNLKKLERIHGSDTMKKRVFISQNKTLYIERYL